LSFENPRKTKNTDAVNKYSLDGLHKIYIQKLAYLLQVLTPILHNYYQVIEYNSYHHGPYSQEIDKATKYLVSRYLIAPNSVRLRKKDVYIKFEITKKGKDFVSSILDLYSVLRIYHEVSLIAVFYADYYGFENLTKMVYKEPNFISTKKYSFIPFSKESNQTFSLFESLRDYFMKKDVELTFKSFCGIFFDLLYQKQLTNTKYIDFDWSFPDDETYCERYDRAKHKKINSRYS